MNVLGVIEGFYGPPWTAAQRERLFLRMQTWGMETYLYAPKDDPWHRQRWREPYPPEHAQALADLTAAARQRDVRVVYALSPGLDLDWNAPDDRRALTDKFTQVAALGVTDFALLFDDIPYSDDRAAQARVQVQAAHAVVDALWPDGPGGAFLFCPTEYCADRAVPSVTESPYLRELGSGLRPGIEIFWTGPQVVSPQIGVEDILAVNATLRRPVLLWDNLHASDYTLHRVHLGPYAGRPLALREHLSGILSNPNTPLEPNTPGLYSLADYARADAGWTPHPARPAGVAAGVRSRPGRHGAAGRPARAGRRAVPARHPGTTGPGPAAGCLRHPRRRARRVSAAPARRQPQPAPRPAGPGSREQP